MKARALAVILAAGEGKRMHSMLPKVLHRLAGQPLIEHVVQSCLRAEMDRCVVVVGHRRDMVIEALNNYPIEFVLQEPQLGTGHAMQQVMDYVGSYHGTCLVLLGDAPFITAATITRLVDLHRQERNAATMLTAQIDDPTGYGRVIRGADGQVDRIVEHGDAGEADRAVREINSGIYCFEAGDLSAALGQLQTDNQQQEYYLTDTIAILRAAGRRVGAVLAADPTETLGINDFRQLQRAEELLQARSGGGRPATAPSPAVESEEPVGAGVASGGFEGGRLGGYAGSHLPEGPDGDDDDDASFPET